ncbi:MAG: hypothetical protein KDK29_01095 [Sedimentitalea sp.]|nr:hypothetical protein [Sedimentitalea sp.]
MTHPSLDRFLGRSRTVFAEGPVALIFIEDEVEIASTIDHHLGRGFAAVLALMPDAFALPETGGGRVHRIRFDPGPETAVAEAVNRVIAAAPGAWLYYGYNAEYLFYPFCESRSVGEMLAFHAEERRDAMLTYVIDLYAGDLGETPDAVNPARAYLDRSGYYAQSRIDPATGQQRERQLDFFGGLRWRFEEHVPPDRRRIDRIGLFRARSGLRLGTDLLFDDPEYNTYACPWHHNLTAAICSFRTAKALKRNPGSTFEIDSFLWHGSVPFEWRSGQLLDLGLMEPGQWF